MIRRPSSALASRLTGTATATGLLTGAKVRDGRRRLHRHNGLVGVASRLDGHPGLTVSDIPTGAW